MIVIRKRFLVVIALCLAILVAVPYRLTEPVRTASTSNWGLGFGAAGTAPTGNADAAFLRQ